MNLLKITSKPSYIPDQPNTRRRSFMWKIGAAIPALLASTVPGRSSHAFNQDAGLKNRINRLTSRLGILEDENAIRRLHHTYEDLLHNGKYEEVTNLFTDDGEVIFNGGIFKGKFGGVRRLYSKRFRSGLAGRKIEPPPGLQPDNDQQQDIVKVAADRKSASARFSFSVQIGTPILSDSQLVKMARLQGEGIMKWWEGGKYEVSYVKGVSEGVWKIRRLQYRVLSKADYRPGKLRAKPISIPLFSKVYPEDPAGPDVLADENQRRMDNPMDFS
jgi:hypothetical protein